MSKIGITLHPPTSPDRTELDILAAQIADGVRAARVWRISSRRRCALPAANQ